MQGNNKTLSHGTLGQETNYISHYTPSLLFPIARSTQRQQLGITGELPFFGIDTWNAYELSWLNQKSKPMVAVARFDFSADSPNLIESKSFKLYLNSFNNHRFDAIDEVRQTLIDDLSKACGKNVSITLNTLDKLTQTSLSQFQGTCIDNLDIHCDTFTVNADMLRVDSNDIIEGSLYSNLLKSNCPVTGQPDWGTVLIHYKGKHINHESLLQYIISYRNHNEFHEHCVENMFIDIMSQCHPQFLTVHARYTRRGGLDINPIRSTEAIEPAENIRLERQ